MEMLTKITGAADAVKDKVTGGNAEESDKMKDARSSEDKAPGPPSTATPATQNGDASQDKASPPGFVSDMMTKASETAKDAKDSLKDKAKDANSSLQAAQDALKDRVPDAVKDAAAAGVDFTKQKQQEMKAAIVKFVKKKVEHAITKRLEEVPGLMKSSLADPDMPKFIARAQDRVIDELWKDVREEVLWEIALALDASNEDSLVAATPDCFRAFWRYHLFPYDRTFWRSLKDPVFVITQLVGLVPVMGVAPLLFVFIFLIIDKSDEFQLIQFILRFKGMQFITLGLMRALVGYFTYYGCTIGSEDNHDCENTGPGTGPEFLGTSFGLVICVFCVWIAFLMLPYSKEYGRQSIKGTVKIETTSKPGGRIRPLLWWDLFAAFLCLLIVAIMFVAGHDEMWRLQANMYWTQILYGLMAFPFFVYTMPVLKHLMTHARYTAYDPQGRCVRPYVKPRENKKREEDVTDAEVDDLFSTFTKGLKIL